MIGDHSDDAAQQSLRFECLPGLELGLTGRVGWICVVNDVAQCLLDRQHDVVTLLSGPVERGQPLGEHAAGRF
jgi:hypothetical protein